MNEFITTHLGTVMCGLMGVCMFLTSLPLLIGKERAAGLVSGFNTLPAEERKNYDTRRLSRDTGCTFLVSAVIFAVGVLFTFWNQWAAAPAFAVWLVYFLKDVHVDAHKAFEKYRL